MSFTIEAFNAILEGEEFKTHLKSIITIAGDYSYQGFKPQALFSTLLLIKTNKNIGNDEFVQDIASLLALFHARGPNTNNLKSDNTKGGTTTVTALKNLTSKYSIKPTAAKNADYITLPRLSQTFPFLSIKVWSSLDKENNLNKPVSENEIGIIGSSIVSPNCIPSLLTDVSQSLQSKLFIIHCLYQSILSFKTQKVNKGDQKKTKQDLFVQSSKYALLSYQGSFSSAEQKDSFSKSSTSYESIFSDNNILEAMKKFFSEMPSEDIQETPTKYHIILLSLQQQKKDFSEITLKEIGYTEAEVKKNFIIKS